MNGGNRGVFKNNFVQHYTHMKTEAQPVFIIAKATYHMNSMNGGRELRSLWWLEEISSINSDHSLT